MITKKDIIDYIMSTPHNTNPSVLNSMLDAFYTSMISQGYDLIDKDEKQLKSSESFQLKSNG